MLKRNRKRTLLCAIVSLSCLTAFPSFAAATPEEYKTESDEIREECKEVKARIDALRQENDAVKERYDAMRGSVKESGTLPENVTREEWKQLTELRRQVYADKTGGTADKTQKSRRPAEGEKKNSDVRNAVKEGDYEAALELLNAHLARSREMLEELQAKQEIWQQIENMMNSLEV